MYSEQLEQLIQSVIADGVVTEKERAVLHKRAAAEGVDEDEIDVYVDALLAKVEPKEKEPKKYNLSVFNKVHKGYNTYYLFQKFYKITFSHSIPVKEMLIAFADVVRSDNDYYLGMKLIILVKYDPNYSGNNHNDCNLKTNIGSLQLPETWCQLMHIIPKERDGQLQYVYNLDAEQLKMLADSESFNLSLGTIEYKPYDKDGNTDYKAASTFAEIMDVNCPGLQSYAQCFYREVVDNTAYLDAEITNMPPSNCSIRTYSTEEDVNDVDAKMAAGLLSINPKKLEKTDVDTPLMKQYIGVNDIVVTHISEKKRLSRDSEYPVLRLHALTHPQNGTEFYFGYIFNGRFDKRTEIMVRVNMQDYKLEAVTKEERVLERDYIVGRDAKFNFYAVDSSLLEQILTTKTGVSFYDDNKEFKVDKMPKTWQKAYTLLTDSESFEQWKQEQLDFKEEHPILNFFRSLFS